MFPLEQEIINKHRRFWCGLALKHSEAWYTIIGFEQDDWWHKDLAPAVKLPVITEAAWNETIARVRAIEAATAYTRAKWRFSGQLDRQGIDDFELGSELRLRS